MPIIAAAAEAAGPMLSGAPRAFQSDPNCSPNNPMFVRQEQPAVGEFLMAGSPLEFGRLDREDTDIAPRLGEHTEEVLSQVLHLSSGEIGRLSERDVVLVR